jgi:LysR family hydrogen peroxide-inducible transcriptional activator
MEPTLRQLEYVVALAASGRFVEAAQRCSVTQPALSKQIREVETMLGVQLFERSRPRLIVTPAGEEIVRRARDLLAGMRELVAVSRTAAGRQHSALRLGVIPTIAPYGLPGVIAKLRARFPNLSVAIEESRTATLLDQLRDGVIDLGLLARPFDSHGLGGADLVREPFVLVAPGSHPLARRGAVSPAEIEGAGLILMREGHCLRDQVIDICGSAGAPPPTSVTAASIGTLVRMVESGLGPTLIPAAALAVETGADSDVVARSFACAPQPGRTLTLAWRRSTPHAAWFTEISAVFRDHYLALNAELPEVSGPRPEIAPAPAATE